LLRVKGIARVDPQKTPPRLKAGCKQNDKAMKRGYCKKRVYCSVNFTISGYFTACGMELAVCTIQNGP